MEDQVCPRCRTTKYRNPSLKLLVNVCGHSLCESCVDLLFLKGSGSCPECQIPLRRSNFRVQLFEDPQVEKEVDIRRRILKDYNKKEEDFPNTEAYYDYLEEIEDIIFNLANGIDVMEMNRRIEQYKRDNKETILRNRARIGRSELELEEMLETEKRSDERRRLDAAKEEAENKKKKLRAKEALIDELMFSEGNAKSIVQNFAAAAAATKEDADEGAVDRKGGTAAGGGARGPERATQFSTGIKIGKGQEYYKKGSDKMVLPEEGPLYRYEAPKVDTEGPSAPDWEDCRSTEEHIRKETVEEMAGGFEMREACLRAIQEAVAGLYYSARDRPTSTTAQ